ncbi:hypothetical protein [Sphingopyxis sp. MWB1]|uniref:hypothetical protein n=1 Tax=Sphingopyxis sp. MWB1 TaxID=1537715 RepID=UPI00051A517B|nr:hypothetical protein [Sphingopyxis sp. MWB1]
MIRSVPCLALFGGLSLALAGCTNAVPRPKTPGPVTTTPAKPVQTNSLIGSSADAVGRMFGSPRLDIREGAGRKMQFSGTACTLDLYLYAPREGTAAVTTHVDARTPDGRDMDVNRCVEALRR